MKVTLVKLKEVDKPYHPQNIKVGFEKSGEFIKHPVVGETFWVGDFWRTSPVTKILSNNIFETLNSVYYYEITI
jgi:hypothetical protein